MAHFRAQVEVAADPLQVWAALTDWPSHSRWAPGTQVRVLTDGPAGVGQRFVARTGLGPIGFDDPMEVTDWTPPTSGTAGHLRVVKQGRVVLGWATIDVVPRAPGRTHVVWDEDVQVAPTRLTGWLGPVFSLIGRVGFTGMLKAMGREVEAA